MHYNTAKAKLIKGEKKHTNWFKKNNYMLEYAYSLILSERAEGVIKVVEPLCSYDIRADWIKKLVPVILNQEITDMPSYLQVRNFLEIDLDMFIKANLTEYVNNILNHCDFFYYISRESYKFIGRALFYNNETDLALKFFKEAKNNFYNDVELHYLLGLLYKKINNKEECKKEIMTCMKIIPDYYACKNILKEIT